MRRWALPMARAYAVYVDDRDMVWLSDWGANAMVRFDPATEKFQSWIIPGGGDIVRNMDVTADGNPVLANSLTNEVGLVQIK
jgi:virginiamycin B lyase